ncbi:MAG: hypothetical protein ACFFCO_11560 [Promethearchaeota archaeon]
MIKVKGLDAFNGTPVLDLKPYSPERKVEKFEVPKWYENILAKLKAKADNILDF